MGQDVMEPVYDKPALRKQKPSASQEYDWWFNSLIIKNHIIIYS